MAERLGKLRPHLFHRILTQVVMHLHDETFVGIVGLAQ